MELKIEEMHQFLKAINIHRISLININIGIKEVDDGLHSQSPIIPSFQHIL